MIVMSIIIWTLLGLFILLSMLLLTPVGFSAQAGLDETASFEAVLVWAGGLASFQAAAAGGQPLEMRLRLGRWTRRLQPESTVKMFDLFWTGKVSPYLDKQVLKEVFRCLFRLERLISTKTIIGEPITAGNIQIIPVMSAR